MIDTLLAIKAVQDVLATVGIYPQSMVDEHGKRTERTEWQNGWNAAIIHISEETDKQFDIMSKGVNEDLALLTVADVGWLVGDEFQLNMNDTFYYGADMESVSMEEVKEVARLFRTYGGRGIDYWVAEKRGCDPEKPKYREGVREVRGHEASRPLWSSCWLTPKNSDKGEK
jgi:hypothetical protein